MPWLSQFGAEDCFVVLYIQIKSNQIKLYSYSTFHTYKSITEEIKGTEEPEEETGGTPTLRGLTKQWRPAQWGDLCQEAFSIKMFYVLKVTVQHSFVIGDEKNKHKQFQ